MYITFFRSSSYNCWDFCPMQFYLTYVLGLKAGQDNGWQLPASQFKADKGSLVHKALELLACKKLALQQGRPSFEDEELGRVFDSQALDVEEAFEAAWQHYSSSLPHWQWSSRDYRDCRGWVFDALSYNGGLFNPLRRQVLWPERHFAFTIDEPWAHYSYTLADGTHLEGQLGLKGTIDLVCQVDEGPDCIELIDWKTGQRKDWASGQVKDFAKLRDDPQLRLYHYALARLCPQAREIIITIVFIRDGGPFSLPYDRDDLKKTEKMLRDRFELVRQCSRPPRIRHHPVHGWKCGKLCTFGINTWPGTSTTVCDHLHGELLQLGIDRVTARHGNGEALTSYGGGGGRSER